MTMFTVGQAVVVTDRRDLYAYEEGTVVRGSLRRGHVGVHFPVIEGEPQNPDDVRQVSADALAPLPQIGERRRWKSEVMRLRGPFVIQSRADQGERPLFTIYYEASRTHAGASAAELAGFSELITEPDGAEDGTTADARADVAAPVKYPPGTPEYAAYQRALTNELDKFAKGEAPYAAARVRDHLDNLDTLRDCVLEHGLTWDENPNGSTLYDLREAIRAYRTARDS